MNTIQTVTENLALSANARKMRDLYYEILPFLQIRYEELIAEAAYARQKGRPETERVFRKEAQGWAMAIDKVQDLLMDVTPQAKQPGKLMVVPK